MAALSVGVIVRFKADIQGAFPYKWMDFGHSKLKAPSCTTAIECWTSSRNLESNGWENMMELAGCSTMKYTLRTTHSARRKVKRATNMFWAVVLGLLESPRIPFEGHFMQDQ